MDILLWLLVVVYILSAIAISVLAVVAILGWINVIKTELLPSLRKK